VQITGRRGYTIAELVVVLTVVAITLAIALPRAHRMLDAIAVRAAAGDVASLLASARSMALAGHASVAVHVDSVSGVLRVRRGTELLLARNIGPLHGVQVGGTRDSLTYDGRGLGRGAANLSIFVRRGAAAETIFVSRLGRVR
jgi:prepilin-type N-terminal cleavage/methylation domain-containing protein